MNEISASTSSTAKRLFRVASGIAVRMEREWFIYAFVLLNMYVVTASALAQRRFWFDEVLTFHMSKLPSIAAIWDALKSGADLNPPLFYAATRAGQSLAGQTEFGTRLPALLGFAAMIVGIFFYVSRYGSRLAGLAAMALPLLSGAFHYSTEARGYGMMLGFASIGAVFWQMAARGEHRFLAVPATALALSGILSSHAYGVLAFGAFALAELVRTVSRRRPDWPVWLALTLPSLMLLVIVPLKASIAAEPFDNPIYRSTIWNSFQMVVGDSWLALLAGLLLAGGGAASQRLPPDEPQAPVTMPLHEIALAVAFLAAPVFAAVLAAVVTRIFMDRYGLPAIIGLSVLSGMVLARCAARCRAAVAMVVLLFIGLFGWRSYREALGTTGGSSISQDRAPAPSLRLADLPADVPIVVANGLLFLEFDLYEPESVARRLYFLNDRKAGRYYTGTNGWEAMRGLAKWFPLRAQFASYGDFVKTQSRFFVLSQYGFPMDWALRKMVDDGIHLRFHGEVFMQHGPVVLVEAGSDIGGPGFVR